MELGKGVLDTGFRFRDGDLLFHLGESYREALRIHSARIRELQDLWNRADRCPLPGRPYRQMNFRKDITGSRGFRALERASPATP